MDALAGDEAVALWIPRLRSTHNKEINMATVINFQCRVCSTTVSTSTYSDNKTVIRIIDRKSTVCLDHLPGPSMQARLRSLGGLMDGA